MRQRILGIVFALALVVAGCARGETNEPEKQPTQKEDTKEPVEETEKENTDLENKITLYYIDENTGNITTQEVTVKGDVSKNIIEQLKETMVLSEACDVGSIEVNEIEKKIELAVNSAFGEYIRGMGTSGSEQVLECLVKTYTEAYNCDGVKITEDGKPFDTGHAVLDGYISYK